MLKRHLILALTFFLILSLFFIASGVVLFYLKTDFSVLGLQKYYRPDLFDPTAGAKTWIGLAKVAVPHMFAMALFWFVISHFLLFAQNVSEPTKLWLSKMVGLSLFFYNLCPFLITYLDVRWAYLMFALGLIFQLGLCAMIYIVLKDAFNSLSRSTKRSTS